MVGPFALFFHAMPWEWRDRIEHSDFLALEAVANQIIAQRKQQSRAARPSRTGRAARPRKR